jgi:hypothetical protein
MAKKKKSKAKHIGSIFTRARGIHIKGEEKGNNSEVLIFHAYFSSPHYNATPHTPLITNPLLAFLFNHMRFPI